MSEQSIIAQYLQQSDFEALLDTPAFIMIFNMLSLIDQVRLGCVCSGFRNQIAVYCTSVLDECRRNRVRITVTTRNYLCFYAGFQDVYKTILSLIRGLRINVYHQPNEIRFHVLFIRMVADKVRFIKFNIHDRGYMYDLGYLAVLVNAFSGNVVGLCNHIREAFYEVNLRISVCEIYSIINWVFVLQRYDAFWQLFATFMNMHISERSKEKLDINLNKVDIPKLYRALYVNLKEHKYHLFRIPRLFRTDIPFNAKEFKKAMKPVSHTLE